MIFPNIFPPCLSKRFLLFPRGIITIEFYRMDNAGRFFNGCVHHRALVIYAFQAFSVGILFRANKARERPVYLFAAGQKPAPVLIGNWPTSTYDPPGNFPHIPKGPPQSDPVSVLYIHTHTLTYIHRQAHKRAHIFRLYIYIEERALQHKSRETPHLPNTIA